MTIRVALLLCVLFGGAFAQEASRQGEPERPTASALNGAAGRLEVAEVQALLDGVDPESDAAKRYRDAITRLERAATLRANADSFRKQAEEAPAQLASIREELAQPAPAPRP